MPICKNATVTHCIWVFITSKKYYSEGPMMLFHPKFDFLLLTVLLHCVAGRFPATPANSKDGFLPKSVESAVFIMRYDFTVDNVC